MKMLSVAIITKNTFYKLGLISLLKKTFNKMSGKDYLLIDSYEKKEIKKPM